jgi:putative solute:sodium symporter small subunit
MSKEKMQAYWKKNIRKMTLLLAIWFLVSYVFGIFFVEQLNAIKIAGFPLGFWFAQQGSVYVFVILIFVYVRMMNTLDKEYGVDE